MGELIQFILLPKPFAASPVSKPGRARVQGRQARHGAARRVMTRHGAPRSSEQPPNMVKHAAAFGNLGRGASSETERGSGCHQTQQPRESEHDAGRARSSQTVTHCTNHRLGNLLARTSSVY